MDAAPFDTLLDRYQSGEASSEELNELDQLLRADAARRRVLVERTLLEVHLRKFFGGLAPAARQQRPPAGWRPGWLWLIVGVGTLLLSAGLWLAFAPHSTNEAGIAVESGVVRVNRVATAMIPAEAAFEVGGQIPAVLRLPDGAHAELDNGTQAKIHAPAGKLGRRIAVAQGGGKFVVAAGQAPLRVETPAGAVVASAAQFTARLSTPAEAGAPRSLTVAVSVGSVEVQLGGQRQMLAAGEQHVFTEPTGN
jgi:hypothetical protein